MGMESFFVSVISEKMSIEYSETRKIIGYDERFNIPWDEKMREYFDVISMKDFLLIDSVVEVHCEKTPQGGSYITLIGCMSCFEGASNAMKNIIDKIACTILPVPIVFIFGNLYPYNRQEFLSILETSYSEKREAFHSMFPRKKITYPSQFYKNH